MESYPHLDFLCGKNSKRKHQSKLVKERRKVTKLQSCVLLDPGKSLTMHFAKDILENDIFKRLNASKEKRPLGHNRLAIRNNDEIIYAVDSSIRYTKLSQLGKSYELLDVNVQFTIKGIKMNSSGTLLAIYNDTNIVVTTLPRSNTSRFVKTFIVGSSSYGASNKIINILWNKIARHDSTLVILSEDSIIRTFELNHSFTSPKQIYNLSSNGSQQVGLATNVVENPVSISFGSQSNLKGLLTLYILDQEGDIFCIYPFISEEISVEESSVEDFLNEIVLSTNSIFDDESSSNYAKKLAIDQLRFINSVWKQIPLSQSEVRGSKSLKVLQNQKKEFTIQGPLSIQPYPEALYDDEATSLITISNDTTDLLAVSFKKNGVILLFQDSLFMKWNHDEVLEDYLLVHNGEEEEDFYPVLSLLEHKVAQSLKPSYITPLNGLKFLLENNGNYFKVDLNELGENLSEAIKNGDIDDALGALSTKSHISKMNVSGYEGSGVLTDAKGIGYEIFLDSATIDIEELSEHPDKTEEMFEGSKGYNTFLRLSSSTEIAKLVMNLRQFKLNLPPQSIDLSTPDENTLKALNSVSSDIMKQLVNHHKLGVLLNYSLIDQKKEIKRQVETTDELFTRLAKVNTISIDKIQAKQTQLNDRFAKLSDLLQKNQSNLELPLSAKEKQWFKEIHTLTTFFNSSLKKNFVLDDQIKTIKNELKSRTSYSQTNNSIDNWDELNQMLQEGKKLIARASSGLHQNVQELDRQLGQVHI